MAPLVLGSLTIEKPVILAPMVGLSHAALRELIASFGGCGLTYSEMLSARRLPHELKNPSAPLVRSPGESPFFYQLVSNEPKEMALAIETLEKICHKQGESFDGLDINMGCSAPGIRHKGLGAGLVKKESLALSIVAACRKATDRPLTVKLRLGMEEDMDELITFAGRLEGEGIDGITLHPRLIKERFTRTARWKYVKALKEALKIPVIGNGDISSLKEIDKRFDETGCDAIMIGRLAVQKPWIFKAYEEGEEKSPDIQEVFFRFAHLLDHYFAHPLTIRYLKKFTRYYAQNFRFGHHLHMGVHNSENMKSALEVVGRFFGS